MRKYYAISGMTVAMSDAEGLKYLLTDHLGSVTAVTDEDGELLAQQRYKPFGAVRENIPQPIPNSPITQTDFGYTGQRGLAGMGLLDYKARFYDSNLMRFIQPDTIIPNPADPQAWNRFGYVRNNPVRFGDPTGHKEEEGCETGGLCELQKKQPEKPTVRGRAEQPDCVPGNLVDCFYDQGVMPSGDWNITSQEYSELLNAIKTDIDRQNPRVNYLRRTWYDTPFYNLNGLVRGSICVDGGNCHKRTEYNYVAQGMWSAAVGEDKSQMTNVISWWKDWSYGTEPSEGTLLLAEQGFDSYVSQNQLQTQ